MTDLCIEYALKNEEFILYYQPLINIESMTVFGAEALLRWDSSKFGLVSPAYFIDELEHSRLMNDIGCFVFRKACETLKKWNEIGYNEFIMSINISEKQLEEKNFLSVVDDILNSAQIDPALISIEITERNFINPTEDILNVLYALRDRGIKIYIDDFGTKYSSLSYLCTLPIDGIKIDKIFVDMLHTSENALAIIKNIVNLADEIGIDVIAEGVESEEQLKLLKKVKCHKVQGFYFSKPVDSDKFTSYLIDR